MSVRKSKSANGAWWKVLGWSVHWQILGALVLGVGLGFALRELDPAPRLAIELDASGVVTKVPAEGQLATSGLLVGARLEAIEGRGQEPGPPGAEGWWRAELDRRLDELGPGKKIDLGFRAAGVRADFIELEVPILAGVDSARERALAPLDFLAELFRRLLQMLIVPLVATSLVSGVTSLGKPSDLGRLGAKTLAFYILSSFLAIFTGLVLVNIFQPGADPSLPLEASVAAERFQNDESFVAIFLRMVPPNIVEALSSNGSVLQVIFFALLFGVFMTRVGGEAGALLKKLFDALFAVMMAMAEFILAFIPLGVLALLARVVARSDLEAFRPLLAFMGVVLLALALHALVTLPCLLWFLARVNPFRWSKAVSPALLTAFSTSSSSITLPVTLRAVEERGGVSNRTSSFVLPLGATVNMDGTALYECVGVIFLAQYYAATSGFELGLAAQLTVVVTALFASIGAAGIPSAGIVMMTTILSVLGLPLEGALLLLAIDRPLDMCRTMVNVWSDTTCSAIIGASEGEANIVGRVPRAKRSARLPSKTEGDPPATRRETPQENDTEGESP